MHSFIDENFREVVWENKIPVKIDMAIEDINDIEKPHSLYVNLALKLDNSSLTSPELVISRITSTILKLTSTNSFLLIAQLMIFGSKLTKSL